MADTNEVRRYADAIITLIKEDQEAGQVPRDVCSWDELDDSVDTEDYYRQAQLPVGTPAATGLRDAVNDEVSRRLAASQGGPWGVTWIAPTGTRGTSAAPWGTPRGPRRKPLATDTWASTAGRIRFMAADGSYSQRAQAPAWAGDFGHHPGGVAEADRRPGRRGGAGR